MKPSLRSLQFSFGSVALVSALWLIGCTDQQPTSSDAPDIVTAQGGTKGKPGSGEDPSVDAVDPTAAPQDTTLDVRVVGAGYDRGSTAELARDGQVTEKVKTNRTKFVSSEELIANITIAVDAETALYDVLVTTSRGRKGIGTELFEVKPKGKPAGDPPITITYDDAASLEITSDGRGTYEHGVCGVSATFNLGDARLFLASKLSGKQKQTCTDGSTDPRRVMVAFTDPVGGSQPGGRDGSTVGANFFKVNEVQLLTEAEGTVPRTVVIGGAGCAHQLLFNPNESVEGGVQVSDVDVTKNPNGTWTVATRPFPDNVAVCVPDEHKSGKEWSYYHIDFSITVAKPSP